MGAGVPGEAEPELEQVLLVHPESPHIPCPPSIFTPRCVTSGLRRKELELETKTSDLPWPREGGKVLWVRT